MCLLVWGWLSLVLEWPYLHSSSASAVSFLFLWIFMKFWALPVTTAAVWHVCRTSTLLWTQHLTHIRHPQDHEQRLLGAGEGGNEHFLCLLLKMSHSISKDPARERRREGACDAVEWWPDEEGAFDCFLFLELILDFLIWIKYCNSHGKHIFQAPEKKFWVLLCKLDTKSMHIAIPLFWVPQDHSASTLNLTVSSFLQVK